MGGVTGWGLIAEGPGIWSILTWRVGWLEVTVEAAVLRGDGGNGVVAVGWLMAVAE